MDKARESKKSLLETFDMVKLRQLNELRKENEFCELFLKSEDGFEIKVHRVVVSSSCKYFKNLLSIPKNKNNESILLPGITGDVLTKIISFIYTSEFEEEIEDVEKIVKYAVIFQLEQLVEICSLALSESINDGTFLKYWRLAGNNLIYSLKDKCLLYIISKADHLFESSLISDLTIEEMRSFLADNRLHLQWDEKKMFEHIWKWSEDKATETKGFSQVFSELVDLLNFSKLENEYVFQKIFGNKDVLANVELLNKIAEFTKPKFIFYKPTQRRLFGLASGKIYIGLGEESTIEKEFKPRRNFGYTTFDNKLLICGGIVENSGTNSCEFFDPGTQEWKKFPSMDRDRRWHQCLYLDRKIYACSGSGTRTVEIFDFGRGEWNYGPEMLTNMCRFGLTLVNGALYAIGGPWLKVEILDPRTQKWSVVNSDHRRNVLLRCVSIGPWIYCFTGLKRYIFDSRSNKFIEEIYCKNGFKFNVCEHDGYIYGIEYLSESSTTNTTLSLNLVQYHLNGKQGYKKSYGPDGCNGGTAIVALYY